MTIYQKPTVVSPPTYGEKTISINIRNKTAMAIAITIVQHLLEALTKSVEQKLGLEHEYLNIGK